VYTLMRFPLYISGMHVALHVVQPRIDLNQHNIYYAHAQTILHTDVFIQYLVPALKNRTC
jgi:hypothetical protein